MRRYRTGGRLPHAMLISGPAGTGKMMLARAFAQYLHCENPRDGEPCGECRHCRLHHELTHPDLHFIYPIVKNKSKGVSVSADKADAWHKMLTQYPAMPEDRWLDLVEAGNSQTSIYVEEAADIVRADSFPAFAATKKIFLIWLPERMNREAANKLLKVIEEPSETTLFLMVSNNELGILPTIFSRVQRLHAPLLSEADIADYLQRHHSLSPQEATRIARISEGSIIRAEELGGAAGENDEFRSIYQDVMRSAYAVRPARLRAHADSVAAFGREKIKRFFAYMARMLRENYIYNLHMPQLVALTPEEEEFSRRFAPFINSANVEDFLSAIDQAGTDIARNGNSKLVLFDLFSRIIGYVRRKEKR